MIVKASHPKLIIAMINMKLITSVWKFRKESDNYLPVALKK
jgi:hypothetical protein